MMKSMVIGQRILKELAKDKRTLALMFLAPLLILTLMNLIFNTNATPSVKIGTVQMPTPVAKQLDQIKHVTQTGYATETAAHDALKAQRVDSVIVYKKATHTYQVTYANLDVNKTTLAKAALQNTLTQNKLQTLLQVVSALPHSQALDAQLQPKVEQTYLYGDSQTRYMDTVLPILMGFFVFFFVFLVSGMAILKERTTGTLERLLATPVRRGQIIFGYTISYGVLAILQTLTIVLYTVYVLHLPIVGQIGWVIVTNILLALIALALGILMSTFAASEFQMMQFIPLIVVPQIFFSGIVPLDTINPWLAKVQYILPLTYVANADKKIMMQGFGLTHIWFDCLVLLSFFIILTGINIRGLKQYRRV